MRDTYMIIPTVYNKLLYYDRLNPTKIFMRAHGHRPRSPFAVELMDDHIS